jgi:YD repeat-containing protein
MIEEVRAPGAQDEAKTQLSYDLMGNLLSITDPIGRITRFVYDDIGKRIKTIFADQSERITRNDALGQPIEETDELGLISKHSYDEFGNRVATIDPEGHRTAVLFEPTVSLAAPNLAAPSEAAFAAMHRPTGMRTAEGRITRTAYDALGRRIVQTSGELADDASVKLAPGAKPEDQLSSISHVFDAVGNEVETMDPTGRITKHSYDVRNRRVSTTDALGRTWRYRYATNAGPSGGPPCCGSDPTGNNQALEIIYPDGTKESKISDALGRPVETKDAKGDTTRYTYDPDGRLETLTDARGNVTKWRYNAHGKLAAKTYPDKTSELFEHDAAGQLIVRTRPNGVSVTNTYDRRGRLLSTVWSDGKTASSYYAYDKAGHMIKAVNPNSEILRTFTPSGRVASETQKILATFEEKKRTEPERAPSYTVSYTYNPDGQIATMAYPEKGVVLRYSYTARGQLHEIQDMTSSVKDKAQREEATREAIKVLGTYSYRRDGKPLELTMGNGLKTLRTYDGVGRLEKIAHISPSGTELFSEKSEYDQRDRRTARVHHDGKADLFTYDPAGQLIAAAYAQAANNMPASPQNPNSQSKPAQGQDHAVGIPFKPNQTFAYDPAGNRKSFQDLDGSKTEYRTNEANQYVEMNTQSANTESKLVTPAVLEPDYDPNGNLLNDPKNSYIWDADIHLLAVESKGEGTTVQTIKFAYDAMHRRVARKDAAGTTTFFVHDGWNVIAEYSSKADSQQPQLTAHRIWGHDISGTAQGAGGIGGLLLSRNFTFSEAANKAGG